MVYTISRFLSWVILKCYCRIKIHGLGNLPKGQAYMLASNHLSYMDPVILGVICKQRLNYMARHDLFLNKRFAIYLRLLGVFPVKRNSADLSAMKEALRRLRQGKSLLVFPEGKRQTEEANITPQAGVGFIAAKAGVPVIPVRIEGTEVALPKGARSLKPAQINVIFGEEISIERRVPYQDTANLIMDKIRHLS